MAVWSQLLGKAGAGPKLLGRVAIFPGRRRVVAVAGSLADGAPKVVPSPLFSGTDALEQSFAWQRGLKGAWAGTLVLHPSEYSVLQIDAPKVAPEERRDAVRWQIKDMVDFAVDQASVDVINLPGSVKGGVSDRIIAVASPSERIAGWMTQYRSHRCALDTIDIPEMAMRNLAALAAGDAAVAFVHIGLSMTRMTIVWQRELCAFRQLEVSARQLVEAASQDREAMLDRLALDIQRTADAFARQFQGADLSKLLLSTLSLQGETAARLAEMTGLAVQPFRLEEHVQWPAGQPVYDLDQDYDFTIATGAALRPPGH